MPAEPYDNYAGTTFNTKSGKIEFYAAGMVPLGAAFADYQKTYIHDEETLQKYPLHFYPGRHKYFMQSQFTNVPELRKLATATQTGVALNPVTAAEKGLEDGDLVEVFNDRGVVKVPCHFSNFIQPGMAHLWYAYGVQDYDLSGPATILGANQNIDEAIDPVAATWGPFWRGVKNASGMPEALGMSSGEIANETIWDVLCDIRRAE